MNKLAVVTFSETVTIVLNSPDPAALLLLLLNTLHLHHTG